MTGNMLALQFDMNARTVGLNTEGVKHQDSVLPPAPGGNCINWVVGHIVASRNRVHTLLGLPPAWDEGAERYQRGSQPITAPSEAEPLEGVLARLRASQKAVAAALEETDDAGLSVAAQDGRPLGVELAFLAFHESYHAGQLGILRRLLGRDGAIK